jgi:glutamine cyclotransferase
MQIMKNRFSLLIIVLVLFSCGSKIKENFNINIIKTTEYLKNKNQIEFFVNNPSNYNITNLEFKINNKSVSSPYTLDDKLGKNILKASFYIDDKQFTINKEFIVYSSVKPKIYTYKILNEFFHDMNSYTQGLEFDDDFLYEGTGQYGYSMLKKINFQTGEVLDKLFLDKSYFGEGITILNDKIFQLTWKSKIGFVYNLTDLKLLKSFNYKNSVEGWGLCNDGKHLYKSDGTEKIWKLNPNNLEEISFINVVTNNKVINKINELEWYNNKIYANTYQFNKEVGLIINPKNGEVEGVIDFSGLKEKVKDHNGLDVLNGIAYSDKRQTFFITGKNWSKLFEIKIIEKN